jgi:hypothetical protein
MATINAGERYRHVVDKQERGLVTVWSPGPTSGTYWVIPDGQERAIIAKRRELVSPHLRRK